MEPQLKRKQTNGLAPLVEWSVSPQLTPIKFTDEPYSSCEEKVLLNGNISVHPTILEVKFEDDYKDSIISSNCSLSVLEEQTNKPKIPDGGWGWVVVFSSFVVSMIADGISFSFGLLYIEFLVEFGASKSVTSWIGSLFMAVPLLTGPVMSALVDRYGCRMMTIVGGLVSGLGFILSCFATSITMMLVTFGVIAGLGLGLCYVTAVVSIAYWFDKKRSLAVGLGSCGTGVGTFVYAPMTQFFISEYGWRGTVLLLAGTFFNMCVCGALMRDPKWMIEEEQNKSNSVGKRSIKNASSTASISCKSVSDGDFPGVEEIRKLMKSGEKPEYILQNLVTSMDTSSPEKETNMKERVRSVVNLPTFVRQSETVPLEVLEQLSANKKLYNVIVENYPSLLLCRSTSDKGLNKMLEDKSGITARVPVRMSMKLKKAQKANKVFTIQEPPKDPTNEPLLEIKNKAPINNNYQNGRLLTRVDSFLVLKTCGPNARHYLKNIKLHKHSVMYRGAMLNIPRYRLRASSCPNIFRNSMTTLARENEEKWYHEFLEILKTIVDFSLYLDLHFMLLSMSTMLLFTFFIVPYFYLAEHLTQHGYTEPEASKVLSIIGVTNFIGMIGLGWAGDQPWLHITKTYSVCLILCGISCTLMMIFADNYPLLIVSAACFGLFFSSNYSFTPAILVELISLDNFTNAYGLILLSQGVGNLIGPPIGGMLNDVTGNWEQTFWQAGIWIVIAGILIGFIPFTENRRIWTSSKSNLGSENEKISFA